MKKQQTKDEFMATIADRYARMTTNELMERKAQLEETRLTDCDYQWDIFHCKLQYDLLLKELRRSYRKQY